MRKESVLLNGDALTELKKLPEDSVDMGVTSPPYNKQEKHKGWLVKNVKYNSHKDAQPEAAYQQQQIDVLNELYRVIKPGGSFFYNHKTRWERGQIIHPYDWLKKTKWVLRQEIIWDRMIAANIRGWRFWQIDERIYWLFKPSKPGDKIGAELKSKHALLTSIWRFPPERKNPHPAPFPLQLPARCILAVMEGKSKGTVIDPYLGSGTTAVAAKLLGFNYLGIDVDEGYINYALDRLNKADSETERLNREIDLHKVNRTFAERKQNGDFVGRHRPNFQENGTQNLNLFN